jgi:hypothetical protein
MSFVKCSVDGCNRKLQPILNADFRGAKVGDNFWPIFPVFPRHFAISASVLSLVFRDTSPL